MADYRGLTYVGSFVAGAAVGAFVALMLAPTSGAEARKYVSRRAEDGKDYLVGKGKNLRRQAGGALEKGREFATRVVH